jgi:hypothetical protein
MIKGMDQGVDGFFGPQQVRGGNNKNNPVGFVPD